MKAKNILYFSENAVSSIQGGGIVVYAVLKGLPAENLLGFYQYRNITPASEYADCFHYLPAHGMSGFLGKVRKVGAKNSSSSVASLAKGLHSTLCYVNLERWIQKDFEKVLQVIDEKRFKPELVYFSGLSYRFLKLALMAAKHFNLPMAVLHMDDWMAKECQEAGLWGNRLAKKINRCMRLAAKRSLSNTTNSPRLAHKVRTLTGIEHIAANNCCSDLRQYLPHPLPPRTPNAIPVITYAGALNHELQGETLVQAIASCIAELNTEGTPVHLHVYTPWEFAPIANSIQMPNAVYYKGQLSREDLAQVYWNSDFLLTTVTYRPQSLTLFRHSLSTKLSEYLCIGKPVISAGHPDWHLHEYVSENSCGFPLRIDENFQRAIIKEQIRRILKTPRDTLDAIGNQNRLLWEKAHNVESIAQNTRTAIGL